MANYSVVGRSVTRRDLLEKVTGAAEYCSDIKVPGMLHGRVVRSPYGHARIVSIDTTKAEKLPGVRGVITGREVSDQRFGLVVMALDQHLLARHEVLFAGEAVAAVAAETPDIAAKAIELIEVEYEELPGVFDVEEAWGTNPPVVVHPDLPSYEQVIPNVRLVPERPNVCNHYKVRHGDVEEGFQRADLVTENRFTTARIQHSSLEPNVCIVRTEPDGGLTVWKGLQGLYAAKSYYSKTFGLPPSKVRVISPYVGGGFGAKWIVPLEPCAVLLARKTGRPVRVALTREEMFSCGGNRLSAVIYIKDGVKKDGTLIAREIRLLANIGAYASSGGAMLTQNSSFGAIGTYRVPNFKLDAYGVYTNEPPVCAFRGFASEQPIWAIESQMDILAKELGIDPVEIRKRNLLRDGDVNANGEIVNSIGARGCLEKVNGFLQREQKTPETEVDPWRRGRGLALGNKFSSPLGVSVCIVRVQEDGVIEVRYSADELGQGANTVMAQIAAEEFGVSIDKIKVVWGDTAIVPYSNQSLGQGTVFNTGNSVRLACVDAKRQLFEIAAEKLGLSPEDLDTNGGKVYAKTSPSRSIAIADLFTKSGYVERGGEILGKDIWQLPTASVDPETGQIDTGLVQKGIGLTVFYSHIAHGAEVAVNVETGEVRVQRLAVACDMGFPINPAMCEQQMDGGAGMGIGSALWEEMVMDEGRVLNPDLGVYKIPEAVNMPNLGGFKTFIVPVPHKRGPYGAKGMGEVVLTSVAPAIANAICDAMGVRIKDLPMTREKVLRALKEQA